MNYYVALLRGINVSGSNKILMLDLKEMFVQLGFANVKTYLQSGNVVFQTDSTEALKIEQQIKSEILKVFGFDISVWVLSKKSFSKIYKNNPFLNNKELDFKMIYTVFLKKTPDSQLFNKIKYNSDYPEEMVLDGKSIYMYYVNGYGRSKVNNNFFEAKLKVIATTRNWRTVTNINNLMETT